MNEEFISIKQVAKLLNSSEAWIKKLIQNKTIPSYKIAGKRLFKRDEIEEWISSQKEEVKAASR
jgi:excisionase family DNA binding protein